MSAIVVADDHELAARKGLAGQHETLVDLRLLQGVVFFHLDFAFEHSGAAGAADAAATGVWKVQPGIGGPEVGPYIVRPPGSRAAGAALPRKFGNRRSSSGGSNGPIGPARSADWQRPRWVRFSRRPECP